MEKNDDKSREGERGYVDELFTRAVPVPYKCVCGKDAVYGANGTWTCTACHQEDWLATSKAYCGIDEDCESCQ